MTTRSTLTHLECGACHAEYHEIGLMNLCPKCDKPLLARYDLKKAAETLNAEALKSRSASLWRYEEVLPVGKREAVIDLGEGWTPLIKSERLGDAIGCNNVMIKDEGLNPTGSFKARGLCMAVSRAYELGAKSIAIPSAGNAAGAACAYAAAVGLPAHVFMPSDVPHTFQAECKVLGGQVTLIDGLITDCGKKVREGAEAEGWFDLSTLKEPYRIEGKKTMGYELAEQLDWELPDVVIYPTGGGTGLIGMWKAFDEMEQMGMIGPKRPRMVSVQSTGCAPIVRAYEAGESFAQMWEGAATIADGLRVPAAVGDFLILSAVRDSSGIAIAIPDADMIENCNLMGAKTGIFAAPEGGACLAALVKLKADDWVKSEESVVIFNTGTGLKYSHLW